LAATLAEAETKIVEELVAVQGKPVEVGGYYRPNVEKVDQVMRPSATFNAALASL
jgi:isocitrate dehydrogenase